MVIGNSPVYPVSFTAIPDRCVKKLGKGQALRLNIDGARHSFRIMDYNLLRLMGIRPFRNILRGRGTGDSRAIDPSYTEVFDWRPIEGRTRLEPRFIHPVEENHVYVYSRVRSYRRRYPERVVLVINVDGHDDKGNARGKIRRKVNKGNWAWALENRRLGSSPIAKVIHFPSMWNGKFPGLDKSFWWNTRNFRSGVAREIDGIREESGANFEVWVTIDYDSFSLVQIVDEERCSGLEAVYHFDLDVVRRHVLDLQYFLCNELDLPVTHVLPASEPDFLTFAAQLEEFKQQEELSAMDRALRDAIIKSRKEYIGGVTQIVRDVF